VTVLVAVTLTVALFVVPAYVGRWWAKRQPVEPCPWPAPILPGVGWRVVEVRERPIWSPGWAIELFAPWPPPDPSERAG
jgi:hypothetical protein